MQVPTFIHCALALCISGGVTMTASAADETITVNTVQDVLDFGGAQQVTNLPGSDGLVSFVEAVTAANNTPGGQTIAFAIPQSEWDPGANMATLRMEGDPVFLNDDNTIVDFSTQTEFTGDTNPDGAEIGIFGLHPNYLGIAAIYINGDNCVIKGLGPVQQRGYAVRINGNNNRVIGCNIWGPLYSPIYIGGYLNSPAPTGNIVGGTLPGEGNILFGQDYAVDIAGPAEGNIVVGNVLKGRSWGAVIRSPSCCPGNDAVNNRIGGPTSEERNIIAGSGRIGHEGFPTGGQVKVEYAPNNTVEGNYIGTTSDGNGVQPGQNGPIGVEVRSSPGTTVRNNVIGGILAIGTNHYQGQRFGVALSIMGNCAGSIFQGNSIGVGADGVSPLASRAGVDVTYWSVNGMPVTIGPIQIGGAEQGQGNIIANSELFGVRVASQITGARITGNAIFGNGTLGIDLYGAAGVTPNDAGDSDTGGNALQNFPVLTTAASASAGEVTVSGTLNSTPNSVFTIEFFSSAACDAAPEGEVFIGSSAVTTDAQGNATFDATLAVTEQAGRFITATATSAPGNTSEFSACVQVSSSGGGTPGDTDGDGVVDVDDLIAVIMAWGSCEAPPAACPADMNHDAQVNVDDLVTVILNWG